jgi:hypothetical protein
MNAQAFTLIAGGDAGWLSDDVPSILGRPARSCRQFARLRRRISSAVRLICLLCLHA